MPELPEVETIRLQLNKYIVGHRIEKVEIRYKKCFEGVQSKLVNAKIASVRRFGKVIVVDLSNDFSFAIHVKLTGQLIYRGSNLNPAPPLSPKVADGLGGKHTHVIFHLDKGGKLFYNDFRKFGWIKVVKSEEVEKIDFIKKLGPEPFKDLTPELFENIASSTKRPIKVVLMDQTKIGGVGNIYANDALWLAQIHPATPANKIKAAKVKELYHAIEQVLQRGLADGGASELSFVTPDGGEGGYQKHFLVYGQYGKACQRCGGKIKKSRIGGRGTFYCGVCQTNETK